jgi:hypothetical protein
MHVLIVPRIAFNLKIVQMTSTFIRQEIVVYQIVLMDIMVNYTLINFMGFVRHVNQDVFYAMAQDY